MCFSLTLACKAPPPSCHLTLLSPHVLPAPCCRVHLGRACERSAADQGLLCAGSCGPGHGGSEGHGSHNDGGTGKGGLEIGVDVATWLLWSSKCNAGLRGKVRGRLLRYQLSMHPSMGRPCMRASAEVSSLLPFLPMQANVNIKAIAQASVVIG